MHNAARGSLAVGGLILVIGIVSFVLGGAAAASDIEEDNVFEGTSGSFDYPDDDWWIVYTKDNVDCESLSVTFTNSSGSTTDEWGDPFFTKDDCSTVGTEDDLDGFQSVGSVDIIGATAGTYTVSASSKIYISPLFEDAGEAIGGALLAACFGLPAIICGVCFLLIGGVLGISLKDKQNVQIVSQQPQVAMVGTPVATPGFDQPAPMAVAPPAAPVANPEAQGYYDNLVAQGHDPGSALGYTQQHYPGFQN